MKCWFCKQAITDFWREWCCCWPATRPRHAHRTCYAQWKARHAPK